jgi:hypothetical protein
MTAYHFNFYLPTYLLPRPQRLVLGHHILAMLYCEMRGYIIDSSFFVFYFLLVISASALEVRLDPMTFWSHLGQALPLAGMAKKTLKTKLPNVLDLLLHSTVFVYFGPSMLQGQPWRRRISRLSGSYPSLLADTDRYWH